MWSETTTGTPVGQVSPRAVVLSVDVDVEPEAVWSAITRPVELATWLARVVEGAPGPGPGYSLEHDSGVRTRHVVRRWERRSRLTISWEQPDRPKTTVGFDMEVLEEGSRVTVRHEDLTDPVEQAATWHRRLEYLAAHLAGQDLPMDQFWATHDELVAAYSPS